MRRYEGHSGFAARLLLGQLPVEVVLPQSVRFCKCIPGLLFIHLEEEYEESAQRLGLFCSFYNRACRHTRHIHCDHWYPEVRTGKCEPEGGDLGGKGRAGTEIRIDAVRWLSP